MLVNMELMQFTYKKFITVQLSYYYVFLFEGSLRGQSRRWSNAFNYLQLINYCKQFYHAMDSCFGQTGLISIAILPSYWRYSPMVLTTSPLVLPLCARWSYRSFFSSLGKSLTLQDEPEMSNIHEWWSPLPWTRRSNCAEKSEIWNKMLLDEWK